MTENPWAKGGLYFLSVLPAWARLDEDCHYLSQAALGWWMAYLACRAVNQTEHEDRQFCLIPMCTPEMTGACIVCRR
jgi:hypothetical protein